MRLIQHSLLTFSSLAITTIAFGQNHFPTSGNVGVGTTTPRAALDVANDISYGQLGAVFGRLPEGDWEGSGTFLGVRGYDTQNLTTAGWKSFALEHSFYGLVNSSINFIRGGDRLGGFITFNTNNNTERMRLDEEGNLLIGTKARSIGERLAVNGIVRAKEIKVEAINWPDYVFQPEYQLKPLKQLDTYIKTNGHLPNVPKASEAAEQGIALGEMNKILLEKIEELTLYIIQQDKRIEQLEQRAEAEDIKKQIR